MANNQTQLIPKNIMQYWSDSELSENLKILSRSWSEVYPDYQYELYDRKKAIKFLNCYYEKKVVDAFEILRIPAMQSDFFRVAYILEKGGMYADLSHRAHKNIDELIDLNVDTLYVFKRPKSGIWNGFIVAPKGNKSLELIFNRILENIARKDNSNAYQVTGPGNFNRVLNDDNCTILEKPALWHYLRGDKLYERTGNHWSKVTSIEDAYA